MFVMLLQKLYKRAKYMCHFIPNFATTFHVVKLDIGFVTPCLLSEELLFSFLGRRSRRTPNLVALY